MKPQAYSYLRMSTEPQLLGDSRRRQLEASRAYAAANGLELAEDAELEDIGVSAFKGANVRDGALGRFLEAVRTGAIKTGSYLIVESLDRLSREQVLTAQSLFLSIIQAGINLVTLMDGRVYRAGTTDLSDLIMSLVIMSRAHEESLTKSRRIAAAWKNKRSEARQKPMTKWCPAWLRLSDDRRRYVPIPNRADIVRRIFEDTANGVGMYSIAARLNDAEVSTFGGPNGWHQSYVAKILANRAVLGEFQPHVRVDGKRVPDGEPVSNYYPAVINEELFYRAQLGKSQRRGRGAGRKGEAFSNLFSGIAKCAYCDSPMLFENKGVGPKGGTYLVCDSAKRRLGCSSLRWRYRDFEQSFLAFVEEIDIASIVDESSHGRQRKNLEAELNAIKGELATIAELMEKAFLVLSKDGAVDFVTSKLKELDQQRTIVEAKLQKKAKELDELLARQIYAGRSQNEIKRLIGRLQRPGSDDLYAIRASVASHLKSIIAQLTVGSVGYRQNEISINAGNREQYYIDRFMREEAHIHDRYFAVTFLNGRVRIVKPKDNAPLNYNVQIMTRDANDPRQKTQSAQILEALRREQAGLPLMTDEDLPEEHQP